MSLPLVSVCIIAYNQEEFISEAIESAISQDYGNLEVIVSDDGSSDGSAGIVSEYAANFPGVVKPLISGPNLGITGNCNRALKQCKGEYAVFMGGDDVLMQGKISAQVEWLEFDERRVLCGHQVQVIYENNTPSHDLRKTYPAGKGPEWLILNGTVYGALSIMVRTSSIPRKGFDSRLPLVSDHYMWIECLMVGGGEYGYLKETYGKYRKHDRNITSTNVTGCLDDLRVMFDLIEEQYPNYKHLCDKGRANQVLYAYGRNDMRQGNYLSAINNFIACIYIIPFEKKIYLRILQSLFLYMKKVIM